MNSLHKIIVLFSAITLLGACSKDTTETQMPGAARLSLTIDGGAISVQGTRAVSESAVNNLWVLQFDASGTMLTKQYIATVTDPTAIDLTTLLSTTANSTLYLVANTGNASLFTTQTLAQAKAVTVALTTTTGGGIPTDASTALPMVGQSAALTFPVTTAIPVNLMRTVAKVTLTVKNQLTTGYPRLTVTSTQLCNVPKSYSTQIVDAANGFTGTAYYPSASAANFMNYTAVAGDITVAGTTSTYYVAPNVRGVGTASDPSLKSDATAAAGQGDYCTYVEILGTAQTSASAFAINVRYRLYLGGNNTNDFNLQSNTAYAVGIKLAGLDPEDARLTIATDKFDLEQGSTDGDNTGDAGDGWKDNLALEVDANGILVLKSESVTRGQMLFFKFGSVVGFTQEGAWAADKVLFNPVTGSPSYADYTSIPVSSANNISNSNHHNGANIKVGRGDPCKLVGLTAEKIQSMTAAELDAYNSGWRLPTKAELYDLTGQTAYGSYYAHWIASDSRYDKWYYSTGSAGGYFPKGQESQKKNYLPAAGSRDTDGSPTSVGVGGSYWSSTGADAAVSSSLNFGSTTVSPAIGQSRSSGFGARCVKEPVLEVDANGILVLKKASETRGQMLFFQFGSVVGFTQEGDWGEDKVLFNPVTGSPSYADYATIPVYTGADWSANRRDISDPAYHTGANIKAGKGDPCKLVGLTAEKIESMTAAELDAYNSGWRLPTPDEQCTFTGQTADASYSAHWIASDSRYDKWYYSTGSVGGYFPQGQESQKKNYLPAAGFRYYDTGTPSDMGWTGYYWSSMAYSTGAGYNLCISNAVVRPLDKRNSSFGYGVRCVLQ